MALDSVKKIVAASQGHEGNCMLEITLESGKVFTKEVKWDPFLKAIGDLIKYEVSRGNNKK